MFGFGTKSKEKKAKKELEKLEKKEAKVKEKLAKLEEKQRKKDEKKNKKKGKTMDASTVIEAGSDILFHRQTARRSLMNLVVVAIIR